MLMDIVWFLVIGLVAGWLASLVTKREGKGIVNYMIIGVVGALLGGCLFRLLHLVAYGLLGELVIATVGAVILLLCFEKFRDATYDHSGFPRCESSTSSAPRLDVPPTAYVPNVSRLHQSRSLILQAPHCSKRTCDNLKA